MKKYLCELNGHLYEPGTIQLVEVDENDMPFGPEPSVSFSVKELIDAEAALREHLEGFRKNEELFTDVLRLTIAFTRIVSTGGDTDRIHEALFNLIAKVRQQK
jgi:hypothetical protein